VLMAVLALAVLVVWAVNGLGGVPQGQR
jgi:hypothetical protein